MVFVFLLIYFYFFVKDKYKKYQLVTLAHSFWNKITHHQERQANEKRTKASHALFNLPSIRFHPVMDYGLTQTLATDGIWNRNGTGSARIKTRDKGNIIDFSFR
jgi:hypothetical protein